MRTRIVPALLIVALLVPLSGCPPTPQVSLGVWLFSLGGGNLPALELGADGMARTPVPLPPGASGAFGGTKSWVQVGSTFTLTLDLGTSVFVYTGTVESSTSLIDGTWMQTVGGTESGTWSAMKL